MRDGRFCISFYALSLRFVAPPHLAFPFDSLSVFPSFVVVRYISPHRLHRFATSHHLFAFASRSSADS